VDFTTESLNFGSAPIFRARSSHFFICISSDIFFRKILRNALHMLGNAGKYIAALQMKLYLPGRQLTVVKLVA
jgi:hypothetical protein